ncbi:glycosyltransferase [Phytopseudomonas dryadis]|uniref:Glycosyltransferase n=1 Tax=Phytopseudomonas dryadis TaxID=2487520 RepID=A0A4Q9QWY7_9GAMM|nr:MULTISPECIES: glycosyltransferase [Pseudomonas]TBU88010.1 glycosyltransferase [Pseudomonas dryadis]TBV00991.1 glycosyltransferase [Pseudomonas dryadis]TBV20057.1 glycosyltransferase [Pseudomonas sp. FRB 230]
MSSPEPWVLQICHGYDGPFLDCARQYASLFAGTRYKVLTVYLSGAADAEVEAGSASDEVVFLGYGSRDMRGLKLRIIRDIARLARSRDFRLCIAHRFKPTYIACLATRLPVIAVNHAFGVYQRFSRRLFANAFRKRLVLLGVSNAVRDDIRSCLPAWPESRIETLYNRIDLDAVQSQQVSREEAREHLGLPQDAWVVGNVGRLHPDKDQATLIRGFALALSSLPANSVLVIVGRGRLEAELRALAKELGVEQAVLFLGQVADAKRYFKAFDVFALTSDHEPFGMVLLEAMAAEIPVICSDCGGGREVVADAGEVFPYRDQEALARCLVDLSLAEALWLQDLADRMQANLARRFTDSAATLRFDELMGTFPRYER